MSFGDCAAYADESGDHSLTASNAENPVSVLAFYIFKKAEYSAITLLATRWRKFISEGH